MSATGSVCSERVSWGSLKLKDSPQSSSPSAHDEVTRLAAEHQSRLREGDESLELPLVAHYGTGRLWRRDPSKRRRNDRLNAPFRRLAAYEDCLDAHVTNTALVAFYERMTFRQLQQGEDTPEFAAVRQAMKRGMETLTGFSLAAFQVNFDMRELEVVYEDGGRCRGRSASGAKEEVRPQRCYRRCSTLMSPSPERRPPTWGPRPLAQEEATITEAAAVTVPNRPHEGYGY